MNKRLRFFYLFALAIPLIAHSAVEDMASVPTGEVLKAGICVQKEVTRRYDQPQSTAGYATNGDLQIVQETVTVPLQKGIGFGFAWVAKNLPPNVDLTYRIEHPVITRPDGITLDHFEELLPAQSKGGRIESIDCYSLSEDHELVPGNWTISILYQGRQLARRIFYVQPPR
jgi:hypothetical protein